MENSAEDIPLCFVKKPITGMEFFKAGSFPLMNQIFRPDEKGTRKYKRIENIDSVQ